MTHKFYQKTTSDKLKFQLTVAIFALVLLVAFSLIAVATKVYFIIPIVFVIIISIIAPFFDVPSLKKSGKIIYYSNLLLGETEKDNVIKIHGGSLFDYFFVLDKSMNGTQRTQYILQQFLEGLLNLIDQEELRSSPNLKIKGTSYIINKRTANKLGFEIVPTDFLQKLILIFNYANILISNSFAKQKFSLPKLQNICTFEADLSTLINKKQQIAALNDKLKAQYT